MTTAKLARQRILAKLQAASALAGVQITYSGPIKSDEVTQEMVFMGTTTATSDWSQIGALQRHEKYTLDLFVRTWRAASAGTEQQAEERTWDLLAAVEDALHADPSLSGLLSGPGIEVGEWTHNTEPTVEPKGFAGAARLRVRCTARVRNTHPIP